MTMKISSLSQDSIHPYRFEWWKFCARYSAQMRFLCKPIFFNVGTSCQYFFLFFKTDIIVIHRLIFNIFYLRSWDSNLILLIVWFSSFLFFFRKSFFLLTLFLICWRPFIFSPGLKFDSKQKNGNGKNRTTDLPTKIDN
jgi:hypothetical protein